MAVTPGEVWSDLDPRWVQDGQGQLKKVTNVESVMASINNIVKTMPGERVMLPQFGSPLRGVLFESMNSEALSRMSSDLKDIIEAWDDRVDITNVAFVRIPDNNTVTLNIQFRIRGYDKVFKYATQFKGEGE